MKKFFWTCFILVIFLFILSACEKEIVDDGNQKEGYPLISETVVVDQSVIEEKTATKEITEMTEPIPKITITETTEPSANKEMEENTVEPVIDGQSLLDTRCTQCHGLGRVTSFQGTEDEWTAVIERMMRKGSELSETEKDTLIQFLIENFP